MRQDELGTFSQMAAAFEAKRFAAGEEGLDKLDLSWRGMVAGAFDALTEEAVKLRQDLQKTNQASLLEHQGWSRINDLVGLQAEQIRTLGRALAQLDRTLSAHLEDAGYSE